MQLTINSSPRGYKLKTPITIDVPNNLEPLDEQVINYVLESLIPRQPILAKFMLENESAMKLAKHLLLHTTASPLTLHTYASSLRLFSQFINVQPDDIIKQYSQDDATLKKRALQQTLKSIDDFLFDHRRQNLAAITAVSRIHAISSFFRSNGVKLTLPYYLKKTATYPDRAPTSEELTAALNLARLREKVIISMLAVGGFRVSTFLALQYKHVRQDLEAGIIPVHVHVEPQITKGKYNSYDTFLNQEAVEFLKAYLDTRRRGNRKTPPENITDDSPIIRTYLKSKTGEIQTITPHEINEVIRNVFIDAGVGKLLPACTKNPQLKKRYDIRVHSLRKFFRTELSSRGVQRDYVEYMMGHKTDAYDDVKNKGVEFLRGIYLNSGISIGRKINLSKFEALKEIMNAWGINAEDLLKNRGADI